MQETTAVEPIVQAALEGSSGPEPLVAIIVPVAFFLTILIPLCLAFYFRYRNRQEVQNTIRAAIDRGQELTPEILERLGQARPTKDQDLRRGAIAVALGAGFAAFGLLVGEEEAVQPLIAIGALPFLIGLAYIGLWLMRRREN